MLTDIVDKAATTLKDGFKTAMAKVHKGQGHTLSTPSVMVWVPGMKLDRKGKVVIKWTVELAVLLKFKDVGDEEHRYRGVNAIVEAAISMLALKKFGLNITPLVPVSCGDATTEKMQNDLEVAYLIKFTTKFETKPEAALEEDVPELLRIGLKYYLQDPEDDNKADASDVIELRK